MKFLYKIKIIQLNFFNLFSGLFSLKCIKRKLKFILYTFLKEIKIYIFFILYKFKFIIFDCSKNSNVYKIKKKN